MIYWSERESEVHWEFTNVQSIDNKIDEIVSRIDNFCDYRDCKVYCFTETWQTPDYPDSALQPSGIAVYRYDRNLDITGKSRIEFPVTIIDWILHYLLVANKLSKLAIFHQEVKF